LSFELDLQGQFLVQCFVNFSEFCTLVDAAALLTILSLVLFPLLRSWSSIISTKLALPLLCWPTKDSVQSCSVCLFILYIHIVLQMSRGDERFVTLHDVKIGSMWGLCAGSYVYEGCSKKLSDGRPCALGKHKRRLRRNDPESPMGPHSRGRATHICDDDGDGTYMYCFAIQIDDIVIQVNEENGKKLLGMSGAEFKAECDGSSKEIKEVCDLVMSVDWTITYVKNTLTDECKAIVVDKNSQIKKKSSGVEASVKRDDHCGDFSGDLVISLKSVRIKHEG
jgi:hypothetical protein